MNLLLLNAGLTFLGLAGSGNDEGMALLLASENNLRSFQRYYCSYQMTHFTANWADAVRGEPRRQSRSAEYLLTVDRSSEEHREKFQVIAESPVREKKKVEEPLSAEFLSMTHVWAGPTSLIFTPQWNQGTVSKKREYGDEYRPLNLSSFYVKNDPIKLLQTMSKAAGSQMHSEKVEFEGRFVIRIRIVSKAASEERCYWIDPVQGFLPCQCEFQKKDAAGNNAYLWRVRLMSAKEYSAGRWFPMRLLLASFRGDESKPVRITELSVKELRLDGEVRPADFAANFPAGCTIVNMDESQPVFFKLKQEEPISPDHLSGILNKLEEVRNNPRTDTALPQPASMPYLSWYAIAILAPLGLIALAVRWRRGIVSPQ